MPVEKGTAPTHQRWPSGSNDQGCTGAVMPKTVKSGVVTKRSTVPVTQDKQLEVKINVTGNNTGLISSTFQYVNHIGNVQIELNRNRVLQI